MESVPQDHLMAAQLFFLHHPTLQVALLAVSSSAASIRVLFTPDR